MDYLDILRALAQVVSYLQRLITSNKLLSQRRARNPVTSS